MARGIYKIELKDSYFPALSAADAVEMRNNGSTDVAIPDNEVEVSLFVNEDHTVRLFLLAKTMYDMEKFSCQEIEVAIAALAREMGYFGMADEIADCVTLWVERVAEDMTLSELEEWLIG